MSITLFDKLFDGAEDVIKGMRKPLVRKGLKRKMRSGWDDAQSKIEKAEVAIEDEIRKVSDINLQACLESKANIRTYKEMQEDVESLYEKLFGEKLDPNIE